LIKSTTIFDTFIQFNLSQFMSSSDNLTKQSVSAVKWSAIGTVARFGLQLCAQIVLARLLGPENYGLFALGLVVLTFSNMLADFGFAWGLVQNQNLSERDIRFVFTWQLVSGILCASTLFFLAPAIAAFFNEPRIEPIIRWLSLASILIATTAPANNLLRRKLDFKSINIIQTASYSIGYLFIGIPLAYFGAGVWALVAAWLSQAFCALIFSFLRSPHSLKFLFWYEGASSMTQVGFAVFGTNISNWMLNNLDRIFLGRLLNAHAVGLYAVGYNLATTPNSLFLCALQPAFLAAGARIQDEPERLREIYLSVLASIWILILPMFVLFAMVAPDLVGVLYGAAWLPSGIVLAILAAAMPAYITWGMSTPILWNTGHKQWESLLQLPILALAALAFFYFGRQGIVVAAAIAAGTLLVRSLVITIAACRLLKIVPADLLGFASRGLAIGIIAGVSTYAGLRLGRTFGTPHIYPFLMGSFAGAAAVIAAVLIFPRILGATVVGMLGRFNPLISRILMRRLMPAAI
jgi:PST family polysaccharide transporter